MALDEIPGSDEVIKNAIERGVQFLEDARVGTVITIEWPNNSEHQADIVSKGIEGSLTKTIAAALGKDAGKLGQVLGELATWAEDSGWKREDDRDVQQGVTTLTKIAD